MSVERYSAAVSTIQAMPSDVAVSSTPTGMVTPIDSATRIAASGACMDAHGLRQMRRGDAAEFQRLRGYRSATL